jgi:cardiolipin synthase
MIDTFTVNAIEKIFKGKFSSAANIQLLWKGNESFTAIFDAINNAEKLICLEFYIFRNDETGTDLSELLKQKSRQGVNVYMLYDHFGSFGTPRKFWEDMKNAGIKIRASRPFKWTSPFNYVHRDHRKLIIIDNKKAFTGGLNIANEYSGFHLRTKGKVWRDTGIMLEGPIVNELFKAFEKWWYIWGGEPIEISNFKFQISNLKDGIPVIPIFVSSARGRRRMRRLLYYSINHAQKSIALTTAYFTPSKRMIETLENAVNRGVRVRLLVPGISDVPAASYAGKAFFSRLLKAGVEIYNYMGEILHAKTSIFDNCWSVIGSTNLDFQSLRYNDEGNVGILDADFTARMNEIFEEDLKHSIRINLEEWHKRPLKEKLKEYFFSFFRRRL